MVDRVFDYCAARPAQAVMVAALGTAMLCGWLVSWYFIAPESPYNREGVPLAERAIYSDYTH